MFRPNIEDAIDVMYSTTNQVIDLSNVVQKPESEIDYDLAVTDSNYHPDQSFNSISNEYRVRQYTMSPQSYGCIGKFINIGKDSYLYRYRDGVDSCILFSAEIDMTISYTIPLEHFAEMYIHRLYTGSGQAVSTPGEVDYSHYLVTPTYKQLVPDFYDTITELVRLNEVYWQARIGFKKNLIIHLPSNESNYNVVFLGLMILNSTASSPTGFAFLDGHIELKPWLSNYTLFEPEG